jgi:uncharacterized protein YozE (UPF0346 family)
LIPSFRESPPDVGFLCRADRVALIDEFFTFIGNDEAKSGPKTDGGNYFGEMKDILEHEEKSAVSGNGRTSVKMSAIAIAVTNPLEYHNLIDVISVAEKVDRAFLSRFLIYQMNEQHINFINENKQVIADVGEEESYPKVDYDFVSLFDYINTVRVKGLNLKKINEIFKSHKEGIPSKLVEVYNARYEHHLTNLVVGCCKYRYIVGEKDSLVIDNNDYVVADEIFSMLLASWAKSNITTMPFNVRLNSIPINARVIYELINTLDGKRILISDVPSLVNYCSLTANVITTLISYLYEVGLLKVIQLNDGTYYAPYWFSEEKIKED